MEGEENWKKEKNRKTKWCMKILITHILEIKNDHEGNEL
jgi:hypothetical protein